MALVKVCDTCGEEKYVDEFQYVDKSGGRVPGTPRQTTCRSCKQKAYHREWYARPGNRAKKTSKNGANAGNYVAAEMLAMKVVDALGIPAEAISEDRWDRLCVLLGAEQLGPPLEM